jgi:hypothetical protein
MTTGLPPQHPLPAVQAVAPLQQSSQGGSGSFLIRADDNRRYWCKALNNTQDAPLVPVNEQIVARLGAVVGIAVCEVRLIEIPAAFAGWEFRPGRTLQPGYAHGSLAVEGAVEMHQLDHRADDENAARHAGFFALYDWLGGQDPQWLYAPAEGNRYYSHDHGHYLFGPAWTPASLAQHAADPVQLQQPTASLSAPEIVRLADRLQAVTVQEMEDALSNLPVGWPISDAELTAVVHFAAQRSNPVAQRLRALPV